MNSLYFTFCTCDVKSVPIYKYNFLNNKQKYFALSHLLSNLTAKIIKIIA